MVPSMSHRWPAYLAAVLELPASSPVGTVPTPTGTADSPRSSLRRPGPIRSIGAEGGKRPVRVCDPLVRALLRWFEARIQVAEADTWNGIVDQLRFLGGWEFDGYQP